jgi:heme/copper-type cytochrome/quinol oxidase subunit 2
MRLKIVTTVFFLIGLVMLGAWPWAIGAQPQADKKLRLEWLLRASEYFIALMVVFFITAVLAWMVARRQREAYQQEKLDNLKQLIEGTLTDHGRDS